MIKPWIRSLIFWVFLITFLIAAPVSVLYTAGFRYNFQNGQIVRTGVISINTEPRGASISLSGRDTTKTSPFILKRLMPGTFQISLSKEGYRSWTGEVEVKSGQTTQIHDVMLFREATPELKFAKEPTVMAANSERALAYLVHGGGWSEIWLYNFKDNTFTMAGRFLNSALTDATMMTWSANGGYLLVYDQTSGQLNIYNDRGEPKVVDRKIIDKAKRAFWHPSSDSLLQIVSDEALTQIDLASGDISVFTDPDAAALVIDASIINFVDNGSQIELTQSVGDEKKLIALLPRAKYEVARRDNQYLILTDSRGKLLLINIHATEPILLETQAKLFDWLENDDLLLYGDGTEVNIYNPWDHSITFITRQSDLIKNVLWHPSGRSVIISTGSSLKAIERYQIAKDRYATTLLDQAEIDNFWIEKTGKTAYFFGTYNGETGVFSLNLTK